MIDSISIIVAAVLINELLREAQILTQVIRKRYYTEVLSPRFQALNFLPAFTLIIIAFNCMHAFTPILIIGVGITLVTLNLIRVCLPLYYVIPCSAQMLDDQNLVEGSRICIRTVNYKAFCLLYIQKCDFWAFFARNKSCLKTPVPFLALQLVTLGVIFAILLYIVFRSSPW